MDRRERKTRFQRNCHQVESKDGEAVSGGGSSVGSLLEFNKLLWHRITEDPMCSAAGFGAE